NAKANQEKANRTLEKIAKQNTIARQVDYLTDMLQILQNRPLQTPEEIDAIKAKIDELKVLFEMNELHQGLIKTIGSKEEKDLAPGDRTKYEAAIEFCKGTKARFTKLRQDSFDLIAQSEVDFSDVVSSQAWWAATGKICSAKIGDTTVDSNILDRPVVMLAKQPRSKAEVCRQLSGNMDDYLYLKGKSAGANNSGKFTGEFACVYQAPNGELDVQRALIKQDKMPSKNIIEVLTSRLMQAMIGGSAATVNFVTAPDNSGYVASYFYDDFNDLYKELYLRAGETPPEDRPKFLGMPSLFVKHGFNDIFESQIAGADGSECEFKNYAQTTVASVLVGDFDVHTANYGVVTVRGDAKKWLVRIDFGAALYHLDDEVHMHSHLRHLPIVGPTNHVREFPRAFRICEEFADELERQGNFDREKLSRVIDAAMDEAAQFAATIDPTNNDGLSDLRATAADFGMKVNQYVDKTSRDALVQEMKQFLKAKLFARQISMLNLALEIRMSLVTERPGLYAIKQNQKLDELILEHPNYFHAGDFHFRHARQMWETISGLNLHKPFYNSAMKEYAKEALKKIPEAFKNDFELKDIKIRAEIFITRLTILLNFEQDAQQQKVLQQQIARLAAAIKKFKEDDAVSLRSFVYKMGSVTGFELWKQASLRHLLSECDAGYRVMAATYQKLLKNPEIRKDLRSCMTSAKHMELTNKDTRKEYISTLKSAANSSEPVNREASKQRKAKVAALGEIVVTVAAMTASFGSISDTLTAMIEALDRVLSGMDIPDSMKTSGGSGFFSHSTKPKGSAPSTGHSGPVKTL
ncbi:MAG: hypothetical protein ABI370_03540, partial [Gammaproteobacteria bacterium]